MQTFTSLSLSKYTEYIIHVNPTLAQLSVGADKRQNGFISVCDEGCPVRAQTRGARESMRPPNHHLPAHPSFPAPQTQTQARHRGEMGREIRK